MVQDRHSLHYLWGQYHKTLCSTSTYWAMRIFNTQELAGLHLAERKETIRTPRSWKNHENLSCIRLMHFNWAYFTLRRTNFTFFGIETKMFTKSYISTVESVDSTFFTFFGIETKMFTKSYISTVESTKGAMLRDTENSQLRNWSRSDKKWWRMPCRGKKTLNICSGKNDKRML
jgi:hypothetical protein